MMGCESWRSGEMKLYDPSTKQRTKKAEVRKGYEGDGKNHPGGQRKQEAV